MTSTGPTYTALRAYHQCIEGMLADPDMGGDLLLIGLCMARRAYLGKDVAGRAGAGEMAAAVFDGGQPRTSSSHAERWRRAMRGDIRRYDFNADPLNADPVVGGIRRCTPCSAPMVRKPAPCGKPATTWSLATDPETGRRYRLGCCSRHFEWYRAADAENKAALTAVGDHLPIPAANTGGILRRHLPGFSWPEYWRRLDPNWTEPPEETPIAKPQLTILINDDFDVATVPLPGGRQRLTLVPS